MKTKPMTMLLAMVAGWINREQQHIIESSNVVPVFVLQSLTAKHTPHGIPQDLSHDGLTLLESTIYPLV